MYTWKWKDKYYSCQQLVYFNTYDLAFALHPRKQIVCILILHQLFACFVHVVSNHQRGGSMENRPYGPLKFGFDV